MISCERVSERFLDINCCGKQYLNDRDYKMVRENGRSDYHILYIQRGACTIMVDGAPTRIEKGHLIIFHPFEPQYYAFKKQDDSISCFIHFSGYACAQLLKKYGMEGRTLYVGDSSRLDKIFMNMLEEFQQKREFFEDVSAAHLLEFLSCAGRLAEYSRKNVNLNLSHKMREICLNMQQDFSENHDIGYYAKMCNISTDRFSHAFRECMGCSPKSYLLKIRVNAACDLLARTNLSNSEIAEKVGMTDVNYFSRIIKKYTGQTPKYFRT